MAINHQYTTRAINLWIGDTGILFIVTRTVLYLHPLSFMSCCIYMLGLLYSVSTWWNYEILSVVRLYTVYREEVRVFVGSYNYGGTIWVISALILIVKYSLFRNHYNYCLALIALSHHEFCVNTILGDSWLNFQRSQPSLLHIRAGNSDRYEK